MIKIEIEKLPLPLTADAARLEGVGLTEQRWSLTAIGPDGMVYRSIYSQEQDVQKGKLSS